MSTAELIAQSKQEAEKAKAYLLNTFSFVPDDKLHWSPSPTARTPIQIVAHCGAANRAFATVLRGDPLPIPDSTEEATAQIRNAGREITTREEAVKLVESSTAEIIAALDTVTEEMVGTTPSSPFGPLPFTFWMKLPYLHMGAHAPQIDYIQTIWGDLEDHL